MSGAGRRPDETAYEPVVQNLRDFRVPRGFRGRSAAFVQLWWLVQALLFRPSPQVLYGWRAFLLRLFGAKIGRGVKIRPGVKITYPWRLTVGDYVWIGDGTELYTLAEVRIGNHVALAQDIAVITGSHNFRELGFDIYAEPIVIEDECWLCAGAFIHQGVTLARGSVVGARAVVRRDTAPFSINVGLPAKCVGFRREEAASNLRALA
jgi:putative colanic acid biosynthesis acetyltransferase WcaF